MPGMGQIGNCLRDCFPCLALCTWLIVTQMINPHGIGYLTLPWQHFAKYIENIPTRPGVGFAVQELHHAIFDNDCKGSYGGQYSTSCSLTTHPHITTSLVMALCGLCMLDLLQHEDAKKCFESWTKLYLTLCSINKLSILVDSWLSRLNF
jgi:hypothetical protein